MIDPISDEDFFSGPEIGAVAHLYRGELYRSTIWRTRLDSTTNWGVVSLGLALSISYSSPDASALPLLLVAALLSVFLYLEARRYRYFNVWRARARWIEIHFYAPMLRGVDLTADGQWQERLASDYERPQHHISFKRALGRRLRRNYLWIYSVQALAYFGKIMVHPDGATSWSEVFARMQVGVVPGSVVGLLAMGGYIGLVVFTVIMWRLDKKRFREKPNPISMG